MDTPKDKILMITDRIGMSTSIASKAVSIAESTYRMNKSAALPRHNFTEKNFTDLLDFTITELKYLISYKEENTSKMKSFDDMVVRYFNIFKDYPTKSKQEGYNLFDDLKIILDEMETSDAFNDSEMYTKVIDNIAFESALIRDPNTFTIEKYKDYISKDKSGIHERWHAYIIRRRHTIINDILNS